MQGSWLALPPVTSCTAMALLYFLVDTFIDTFGITRPSVAGRRRAAFFILALMGLLLAGIAAAAWLIAATLGRPA